MNFASIINYTPSRRVFSSWCPAGSRGSLAALHFCICPILSVPYGNVQIQANKTLHKFYMCSPTLIYSNQLMLILFGVPLLDLLKYFNPDIVSRGNATHKYFWQEGWSHPPKLAGWYHQSSLSCAEPLVACHSPLNEVSKPSLGINFRFIESLWRGATEPPAFPGANALHNRDNRELKSLVRE